MRGVRAVSTVAVLGLAMACTGSDGADTAASASSRTDRAANDPGAAVVDASQAAAPAGAGAAAQREAATTTATTSQAVAPPEPLGGTGAGAAPDPGSSSGLDGGEATGEPPRVEVGRLRGGGTADHGCDFAVRIKGVPAIRADGELFVFEAGDASDLSDFPPRSLVAVATADGSEP